MQRLLRIWSAGIGDLGILEELGSANEQVGSVLFPVLTDLLASRATPKSPMSC